MHHTELLKGLLHDSGSQTLVVYLYWNLVLVLISDGLKIECEKTQKSCFIFDNRASIAICKSRDLHWGLLATKDHRDLNLGSLRLLLVADGANPWSLSSCDQFLSVFQSKGLRADAICPCAASTEGLTVSVRRPGREGINATGRGVLSMSGLENQIKNWLHLFT